MTSGPSTSLSVVKEESDYEELPWRTSTPVPEDNGSSTLDKYGRMGGVPTRIMRPSPDHSFTCYAFSADGSRLAAGDTEGTVRVWKTTNYDEVGAGVLKSGVSVSALAFLADPDDLPIAVDKEGNLRKFKFAPDGEHDNPPRIVVAEETEGWTVEVGVGVPNYFLQHQFSSDGLTLANIFAEMLPRTGQCSSHKCEIYDLKDGFDPLKKISLSFGPSAYELSVPVLSKNGRSLLVNRFHKEEGAMGGRLTAPKIFTEILIYPSLVMGTDRKQQDVSLPGDRACWGLDGECLIVWDTEDEQPRISIYRTSEIASKREGVRPLAKLTLRFGLFAWKAIVLKPPAANGNLQVLVYETTAKEQRKFRRFFTWDTGKKAIESEVHMDLEQSKNSSASLQTTAYQRNDFPVECGLPADSHDEFYHRILSDHFPSFCISDDRNWIGAFTWRLHGGGISSVKAAVTAWKFRLPDHLDLNPCSLPIRVSIDKKRGHFVVLSNTGIVACKPSFLSANRPAALQTTSFRQSGAFSRSTLVATGDAQHWQALPSEAVARKWLMQLEYSKGRFWQNGGKQMRRSQLAEEFIIWTARKEESSRNKNPTPIDASQSRDASLAALLVRNSGDDEKRTLYIVRKEHYAGPEIIDSVQFPQQGAMNGESVVPSRVFLYKKRNLNSGMAVLFSKTGSPEMTLYEIQSQELDSVQLRAERCLDVSFCEDRAHIVILDVRKVHILNLETRKIEKSVAYRVDFEVLLRKVNAAVGWRKETNGGGERIRTERRLADNGEAVLLGWDAGKAQSILVRPDTEKNECETQIQESQGQLSEFCVLSAAGASTSFLRLDKLEKRKLTVGVFNERVRRVFFEFHVVERLPEAISYQNLFRHLPDVFYGVSTDGNYLVSVTIGLHSALPNPFDGRRLRRKDFFFKKVAKQMSAIEDKVRVFSIYGAQDTIPAYEQLMLKRFESVQQTFKRLQTEYDVCAFSAPSSDGLSIFQTAFVKEDKDMVECIKSFAKEQECQLALEWTEPSTGKTCNVLDKALQTKTADHIENALELVCSTVAPFRSGAAITKNAFQQLLGSNLEILEKALKDNSFVTPACDLNVHVDFFGEISKLETAEHIGTSNTYLDWRHVADKNALGKNWEKKNEKAVRKMEADGNKSKIPATLHFVRIEDAAKIGMRGIIRHLLLQRVPVHFFQYDAVKWIVQLKWGMWKARFIKSFITYFLFLAFYVAYVVLMSSFPSLSEENLSYQIACTFFMSASSLFGMRMAALLVRRMKSYVRDSLSWFFALTYFFQSGWNWLDLLSCLLLTISIPCLHIQSLFSTSVDELLSALVAFETLLAFAKIWNYAHPFRRCEQLVRMVYSIAHDCLVFLTLACFVLLSFSLSLLMLFRHDLQGEKDDRPLSNDEDKVQVKDAFGTLDKSLLTLFYALLGDFDQEVYRSNGNLSEVTTLVFAAYLLSQTVLLLNLLIAIMGDTFDRVRCSSDAYLLMGRALFIDAGERELSDSQIEKDSKQIGKYVHVLLREGEQYDRNVTTEWAGKLDRIENMIREATKKTDDNVGRMINDRILPPQEMQNAQISEIQKQIRQLSEQQSAYVAQIEARIAQTEAQAKKRFEEERNKSTKIEALLEALLAKK